MRRCAALFILLSCATSAGPAIGSEESQALSARGLIELNAGHAREALELFDRAVAADPTDVEVRYQRGATRAKLGNYSGAVEDLRAVLAAQPDFPAASLALGIALVENRQFDDAIPYLLQAQRNPELDAQASFYLGLAYLRSDRLDEAAQSFARARARDAALDLPAKYYEGVIAYRRHDMATASASFSAVESANPDSAIGREATQFLAVIRGGERAAYSAFGTLALEYDTNVTLGPSTSAVVPAGISGKGDWRFALAAGGTYVPLRRGPFSIALSYEFFQSVQFRLHEFDLQDNRPGIQLMLDFGPVFFGMLGRYDYYLLETDSFLQEATALPWVTLRESGFGRAELYYRMQWRDYKEDFINAPHPKPVPPPFGFEALDAFYNFAGVQQIFDLGEGGRELRLGGQLGFTRPDQRGEEAFQYGSYQADIAVRWPLPYAIIAEAGFRYEHQRYAAASADPRLGPPDGERRFDDDFRGLFMVERPLKEINEHLFVNAAWFGTFNNSTKVLFEYDRQIGSAGVTVRF
jgi:tetratricopeptide (TPR) repeat protein